MFQHMIVMRKKNIEKECCTFNVEGVEEIHMKKKKNNTQISNNSNKKKSEYF